MERIMKLFIRLVLLVILFANVLLLSSFVISFGRDLSDASSVFTRTGCPPGFTPCFSDCCAPFDFYCDYQTHTCEPVASDRFLKLILLGSSNKKPSNFAKTDLQNDLSDASSVDTRTGCPPGFTPCFSDCCAPFYSYCDYQTHTCEPVDSNRFLKLILFRSSNKEPFYSANTDEQNDLSDASSLDTRTGCPPGFWPCYRDCCPPFGYYCDYETHTCVRTASDRFLKLVLHGSSNKGPSNSAETDLQNAISDTSNANLEDGCPPDFTDCFAECCDKVYEYCDYLTQSCKPVASDRLLNSNFYGSSRKGPSSYAETHTQNDISYASSVDSKAGCPPNFTPCFAECCHQFDFYCDYQSRTCRPVSSGRLLNLILYESSSKSPSYSSETDLQNDASDATCLDTETQCAGGCCPYSNATCCTGTCCLQGSICLDPLNTCLGIKPREKTDSNPLLYTEKAKQLRQVKSCPPFTIPCFGDCCPPIIMHCDSQRQACVPDGETTS